MKLSPKAMMRGLSVLVHLVSSCEATPKGHPDHSPWLCPQPMQSKALGGQTDPGWGEWETLSLLALPLCFQL